MQGQRKSLRGVGAQFRFVHFETCDQNGRNYGPDFRDAGVMYLQHHVSSPFLQLAHRKKPIKAPESPKKPEFSEKLWWKRSIPVRGKSRI
jgi:hypothetical protein